MQSEEIRKRFLAFFEKRGHAVIPSASLVPENDPSVLFTTAGMQPLASYLMGEPHPKGKRLVNVQKCVRTQDIEEVGDNTHDTFFEMLGNWSLGDYFKTEAITWSYEFLTSKKEGLGLDPKRLYVTCFEGDANAPKDEESPKVWESLGVPKNRIYFLGAKDNWWSPGDNGPCGPDTEMFYDLTEKGMGDLSMEEFIKATDEQKIVEVWNDVFMEYQKKDGKVVGKLSQKNVDTGAGLERLAMVIQGKSNIFETDLFMPAITKINDLVSVNDIRAKRIVVDHMRTAVFMIADDVIPSNTDRGYVLRRLLKRAFIFSGPILRFRKPEDLISIAEEIINSYRDVYTDLKKKNSLIIETIKNEQQRFGKAFIKGSLELTKKINQNYELSTKDLFDLQQSFGLDKELIKILIEDFNRGLAQDIVRGLKKPIIFNETEFSKYEQAHQHLSRTGAEQKFKGGLADTSEKTVMLHTSTHLMLAGLRQYLGNDVHQAGSNITIERTRFDFTYPEKVSRDVLDKVEAYVNEAISKKCDVVIEQMPKEKAQKTGVEGSFWEKYPDTVNVYMVKSVDGTVYSQELCGGPHVKNTGDIQGTFKITKEEASSAGVRRIKAVLE